MPSFVISHDIRHIIGIAIMGIPMPGMPPIMGMGIGMPIPMPGIIPFMGIPIGMPIPGIMPPPIIIGFMPIIGMGMGIIIGIPDAGGVIPLAIIGIAFIGIITGLLDRSCAAPVT
ncbi:MAG: hypothetical protein ACJ79R_00465 [Anaeromyxobacteraceae bacterium]